MIISFKDRPTELIFNGFWTSKIPHDIHRRAEIGLHNIHNAHERRDLETPPGNHLEKLKGDRVGQSSIRINKQWRICFRWENGNAYDVEIVDYH